MTRAEAIKMLTAKVECIKRYSSGINEDCNSPDCGECTLWYEQGNMGEQIEYLQMAIKALEETPKTGKWNMCYDDDAPQDGIWFCSVCGYARLVDDIFPQNFCPQCGARMLNGR